VKNSQSNVIIQEDSYPNKGEDDCQSTYVEAKQNIDQTPPDSLEVQDPPEVIQNQAPVSKGYQKYEICIIYIANPYKYRSEGN